MKQSEYREKSIKRRRVQQNRRAEDRKIVLMWVKRIAVAVMVMLLLVHAYRFVDIYQEKQHIEQQLKELQQKNDELEQEKAKLQDPKNIENVAREQLGLVKPGEVPYVK